ncbi:hypothetical protein CR513_43479, partial [Mucuna pruriens]
MLEQDFNEICHHLSTSRARPSSRNSNPNPTRTPTNIKSNYATFDLLKSLVDKLPGLNKERDPNAPDILGPTKTNNVRPSSGPTWITQTSFGQTSPTSPSSPVPFPNPAKTSLGTTAS